MEHEKTQHALDNELGLRSATLLHLAFLARWFLPGRMIVRHVLCLPLLLAPLTVPCKMVFARSDDRETCPLSSPSSCSPHSALQDGFCQVG